MNTFVGAEIATERLIGKFEAAATGSRCDTVRTGTESKPTPSDLSAAAFYLSYNITLFFPQLKRLEEGGVV